MVQNTVFTIIYSSHIPSSTSEALVLFIYLFKVAWTKSFIDLTVSFAYGFPHMFRLAMLASRSFGARRQPSLLWNLLVAQTFLARMWRSATLTWHIVCVWIPRPQLRFAFHVYFFFFSRVQPTMVDKSVHPCTIHESHKLHFSTTFSLKIGLTVLFTHLKIISLHCF